MCDEPPSCTEPSVRVSANISCSYTRRSSIEAFAEVTAICHTNSSIVVDKLIVVLSRCSPHTMAQVTMSVVSVLLTVIVSCFAASFTKSKWCPDGEFYDHGTELCEPCMVICKDAHITNMVEQCQTLCPATYAQLNNEAERPELPDLLIDASKDQSTTSPTGPSFALIAGIISGIVVVSFLVILGAFVCKRVQENSGQANGGARQQQAAGGAERGSIPSRQGYRRAGVQEENGEQAEGERQSQVKSLRGYCDPRHWFSAEVPAEETETGRQGTQEIALLGNSHGSVVQDLSQPKTVIATPIYKPSGSMRSTRI